MRIGVSSSGRWWVSMGPLGWLLTFWIVIPVMAAWYAAVVLGWLCVLACPGNRSAPRREEDLMSIRKLEGTHRFLNMLVCDRCGFKASLDQTGRSVMKDHLAAKHGKTAP